MSLYDILLDIQTKKTTDTFEVYTKTAAGAGIDQITSGLTFDFPCNLPCLSCTNNPNECTSCNELTGLTILWEGQCRTGCPTGMFLENGECKFCSDSCKTCQIDNKDFCTSCDSTNPDFTFLEGTNCVKRCSFGYYGETVAAQCNSCSAPCADCEFFPDLCTACI